MWSRISPDELAVPPRFTLSSAAVAIASPGPGFDHHDQPERRFHRKRGPELFRYGLPERGSRCITCSVTAPPAIFGAAAVTATLIVSTTVASTAANRYSVTRNQHP